MDYIQFTVLFRCVLFKRSVKGNLLEFAPERIRVWLGRLQTREDIRSSYVLYTSYYLFINPSILF
jgi:hypothetical protein